MATYEHPCKCLSCGLHFVAVSWYPMWPMYDSNPMPDNPVCPECGSDALMRWPAREVEGKQIFEIVPGSSGAPIAMVLPRETS